MKKFNSTLNLKGPVKTFIDDRGEVMVWVQNPDNIKCYYSDKILKAAFDAGQNKKVSFEDFKDSVININK